jgi:hypothetical protein
VEGSLFVVKRSVQLSWVLINGLVLISSIAIVLCDFTLCLALGVGLGCWMDAHNS